MSHAEQLSCFKEYGKNLLKHLEGFDAALKGQFFQDDKILTDLRKCVEVIRSEAMSLIGCASSPVKVAVMGEFKASKTTLLGSLLGYAGVLPDSEVAATGNVTRLNVIQVEDSLSTQFNFEVKYLDELGAKQCLDFMLKKLASKASDLKLPDNQLAELRSFNSKMPGIWQQVDSWCKEGESFELKAIDELAVFVQSFIRYGSIVCGNSCPVSTKIAHFGLLLPSNPSTFLDLNFDQIPQEDDQLSIFLQATFPLIQYLDVEVKISKVIWDLSSLQGANKLVLLDFPGLGAAKSEFRDQFLSQREMENVQTILLLTHGDRPGSAKDDEIVNLLRQQRYNQQIDDFILVGIGRFDQLPNAEEYLDKLLENGKDLTEETVLQRIPALKEAVESARGITHQSDERVVLLSAFVGLNYWRDELGGTIEVATPKILDRLNRFQQDANNLSCLEKWKQLTHRLKRSQPEGVLVRWLDSFTKDGGISHLRHSLEAHVVAHGLEQLYKDAQIKVQSLHDHQDRLRQILSSNSLKDLLASETPSLRTLHQAIQELLDVHKTLKIHLEKNSLDLGVGIGEGSSGVPLAQEIEDKATLDVFNWNQWRNLFSKVENGVISLDKTELLKDEDEDEDESLFGGLIKDKQITIFTKSDDFCSLFEETYKDLETFTHARIEQSIKDFLNELSTAAVSLRGTQTTINMKQLRDDIESCLQQTGVEVEAKALLNAASPTRWESKILKNVKRGVLLSVKPKELFPLAYEESHRPGQMFDWSPDKEHNSPNSQKHLFTVLQLRDAMIVSISNKLVQLVSQANQKVNESLRKLIFEEVISALEATLEDRALLKRMAVGEGQSSNEIPDWLEMLKEVVNTRYPI